MITFGVASWLAFVTITALEFDARNPSAKPGSWPYRVAITLARLWWVAMLLSLPAGLMLAVL